MSVQLQMHLPESAASGNPSLLAPLRAQVGKCEAAAQSALDGLGEDLRCSMGFDAALQALQLHGCAGEVVVRVRREVRDAIAGRDGWDTWPAAERDAAIKQLGFVADAFAALADAARELDRAEAAEVAALKGKRT